MKKQFPIFIAVFVTAVLILSVVIFQNGNADDGVSGIRYNSDQPQPWSENLPDGSNAEGIKIPGFGRLYFPADSDRVQMTLANPSDNHCYFVYTINLNESDGELLGYGFVGDHTFTLACSGRICTLYSCNAL